MDDDTEDHLIEQPAIALMEGSLGWMRRRSKPKKENDEPLITLILKELEIVEESRGW